MKITEKYNLLFPKQKQCHPSFPVTNISKNTVIDKNGLVYNTYDYNGETMYFVKFNVETKHY